MGTFLFQLEIFPHFLTRDISFIFDDRTLEIIVYLGRYNYYLSKMYIFNYIEYINEG